MQAILYLILCSMGSQCSCLRRGLACSALRYLRMSLAAEFRLYFGMVWWLSVDNLPVWNCSSLIWTNYCLGCVSSEILADGAYASDFSVCSLTCFDDVLFHWKIAIKDVWKIAIKDVCFSKVFKERFLACNVIELLEQYMDINSCSYAWKKKSWLIFEGNRCEWFIW